MRYLSLLTAILLTACSTSTLKPEPETPHAIFGYSPVFKLEIPTHILENNTIVSTDGLTLILKDGKMLTGQVLIPEMDGLPGGFDMRLYPEYILELKEPIQSHRELFKNSSQELDYSYDLRSLKVTRSDDYRIYSLCRDDDCLAFVIKNKIKYQILSLNSRGFSRKELLELIQGGLNA